MTREYDTLKGSSRMLSCLAGELNPEDKGRNEILDNLMGLYVEMYEIHKPTTH